MAGKDGLCCCEYENIEGEKSHILACCCDCHSLDQIVDR
jgi:palmitoyltransferase